jgi:hypothetical protein
LKQFHNSSLHRQRRRNATLTGPLFPLNSAGISNHQLPSSKGIIRQAKKQSTPATPGQTPTAHPPSTTPSAITRTTTTSTTTHPTSSSSSSSSNPLTKHTTPRPNTNSTLRRLTTPLFLLQQPRDILLAPLIQSLQLHSQIQHPSLVLGQLPRDLADFLIAAVHGLFEASEVGDVEG